MAEISNPCCSRTLLSCKRVYSLERPISRGQIDKSPSSSDESRPRVFPPRSKPHSCDSDNVWWQARVRGVNHPKQTTNAHTHNKNPSPNNTSATLLLSKLALSLVLPGTILPQACLHSSAQRFHPKLSRRLDVPLPHLLRVADLSNRRRNLKMRVCAVGAR